MQYQTNYIRFIVLILMAFLTAKCQSPDHNAATPKSLEADQDKLSKGESPQDICGDPTNGLTPDGEKVVICTKLLGTRPYINPPADVSNGTGADETKYLILLKSAVKSGKINISLVDRKGKTYNGLNSSGELFKSDDPIVSKNYLPTVRSQFLVYQTIGMTSGKDFLIKDLQPYILLKDGAADTTLLGTWEGTMTLRVPNSNPPAWEWKASASTIKFRVTFAKFEPRDFKLRDRIGPDGKWETLSSDWKRFRAVATGIENRSAKVSSAAGDCLAALNSLGDKDPLGSLSGEGLGLYLYPNMHSDDNWFKLVMDYPLGLFSNPTVNAMDIGIGNGVINGDQFSLYDLIRLSEPNEGERTLNEVIHGNPLGAMKVVMKPVKGGGEPCL